MRQILDGIGTAAATHTGRISSQVAVDTVRTVLGRIGIGTEDEEVAQIRQRDRARDREVMEASRNRAAIGNLVTGWKWNFATANRRWTPPFDHASDWHALTQNVIVHLPE